MSATTALSVAGLLRSRPDAIGLPLELLSGDSGLERTIASPHISPPHSRTTSPAC
jgi:hypothetical protein